MIEIKEMKTLEDFFRCVEIQKEVWGFDDPFDAVPQPLLVVSDRIDGIILGAYDTGKMIGFVYSLPGFHSGKKVQWSHMLAVLEKYRDSDTGYRLKMEQYRMAQEKGYDFLEWTYDPLESRNAHFNINKLGCIVKEYEINIYGETSSPLHAGMPTDRFVPHWPIPPLKKELPKWEGVPDTSLQITSSHAEGSFRIVDSVNLNKEADFLFVEIPVNMQQLKVQLPEQGLQWRLKTRDVFVSYFERGYIVYSFQHWKQEGRSFYVLKKISSR